MQITLSPKPPFDFEHTLRFLAGFQADGTFKKIEAGRLRQALIIGGQPVLFELQSKGSVEQPKLCGKLSATAPLTKQFVTDVISDISFYLGLDDDLTPFYELARKDDAFQPILEGLYGFHPVKFPSVFAAVCWALVTQRTPNSFAFKTMKALTDSLGETLKADEVYTCFPPPQAFLDRGAAKKVLTATNNTRKTERLLPLAREFLKADEAFLRTAAYDDVYKWLKALPGLGDWSVQYIMLRGLGRAERTPWTDTWLLEAISRVYTGGLSISKGDARALAEGYGWYQGWWVHYMKTALW